MGFVAVDLDRVGFFGAGRAIDANDKGMAGSGGRSETLFAKFYSKLGGTKEIRERQYGTGYSSHQYGSCYLDVWSYPAKGAGFIGRLYTGHGMDRILHRLVPPFR